MKTLEEMAEAYAKLVAKDWMPNGTKELKNYFIGITIPNEDGSFSYCKNIFTGPDIRPAFVAGYEAAKNQLGGVSKVMCKTTMEQIKTVDNDELMPITNLLTPAKWISVKDRLPAVDTRVLVYEDGVMIVNAISSLNHRWDLYDNGENCRPTHWMPLPKPPEEEK